MSESDPVDVHRALQKAARELAHYADGGYETLYLEAIDRLEDKLRAVRRLTPPTPSFDPAWDKSPEEIARIQALPNRSRLGPPS